MLFPTLKKKLGVKKKSGGPPPGFFFVHQIFFVDFFLEKQFFLISRFMLFSTLKKYSKVPLHLLVKWEVVSPNSREGQLQLYPLYLLFLL